MAARKARQEISAVSAIISLSLIAGCRAPSINLATNQPIKVDIAMRLDVYQHSAINNSANLAAKSHSTPTQDTDPEERRKNRQADIQTFKNSRLIGESRNGLLVVLEDLSGEHGDYVRRTVDGENSDRMALMKAQAEKEKRSLIEIQKEQALLWINRSFKGEWVEIPGKDGTYRWVQKQG